MAHTYKLISSVTVGSGGSANMEFTSIPSTYTDLVIKISSRSNNASTFAHHVRFNSDSGANYSWRNMYGYNSGKYTDYDGAATYAWAGYSNNSSLTTSAFSNTDIYISNYAGSKHKSVSSDAGMETNAGTGVSVGLGGAFWKSTAAITSIIILPSVGNYAEHSTAYLYGISNA